MPPMMLYMHSDSVSGSVDWVGLLFFIVPSFKCPVKEKMLVVDYISCMQFYCCALGSVSYRWVFIDCGCSGKWGQTPNFGLSTAAHGSSQEVMSVLAGIWQNIFPHVWIQGKPLTLVVFKHSLLWCSSIAPSRTIKGACFLGISMVDHCCYVIYLTQNKLVLANWAPSLASSWCGSL